MTDLILGINSCFAVKRWPDPDEWLRIVAEDLGLSHCQFSIDLFPTAVDAGFLRRYAERVRRAADAHGVSIHSSFTGLGAYGTNLLLSDDAEERDQAERWYRRIIELAGLMGTTMTGGHVGAAGVATSRDPRALEERRAQQVEAMLRLADHARDNGLDALLFENLAVPREYGHTIAEALELEARLDGSAVPWLLCLDLGHPAALTTGGESDDPTAWLRTMWRRTPVLQLQQSSRGADRHGPFTAESNIEGGVQREAVYAAVDARPERELYGFLEVIPAHEADDDRVLADLVASVEYWQR